MTDLYYEHLDGSRLEFTIPEDAQHVHLALLAVSLEPVDDATKDVAERFVARRFFASQPGLHPLVNINTSEGLARISSGRELADAALAIGYDLGQHNVTTETPAVAEQIASCAAAMVEFAADHGAQLTPAA